MYLCACVCICVCESCSVMSASLQSPWTVAYQAPLSMGFSRQDYWSGLPFPSPLSHTCMAYTNMLTYTHMYIHTHST